MRALFILLAVGGCEERAGEVHVHQSPTGTHASATFVESAVRYHGGDSLYTSDKADASSGDCEFFARGPLIRMANPIDAGPIRISGSSAKLELTFQSPSDGYRGAPLPRGAPLFAGGELLTYEGAHFRGTLRAPAPLVVPENLSASDRLIRWTPSDASRIAITLIASHASEYAEIECLTRDQAGALEIPEKLWKKLPPPPLDLQLFVRRDVIGKADSERGPIILHASYEVKREGQSVVSGTSQ